MDTRVATIKRKTRAGQARPAPTGPGLQLTAMRRPGLPFNGRHPRIHAITWITTHSPTPRVGRLSWLICCLVTPVTLLHRPLHVLIHKCMKFSLKPRPAQFSSGSQSHPSKNPRSATEFVRDTAQCDYFPLSFSPSHRAMADDDFKSLLRDLTECPICRETLNDPKTLPCLHTFCCRCLADHIASAQPRTPTVCPLCRQTFTVPAGGCAELQTDFRIRQFSDLEKAAKNIRPADWKPCERLLSSA